MSQAELDAFLRQQIADYADTKVRAGQWTPDEAPERSWAEHAALGVVPGRPLPATHRVLHGLDEHDRPIGWVWVGPPPGVANATSTAYLWQITVAPDRRGRGLGQALLAALEDMLAAEGVTELRLNVFAFNTPAVRLYARMGYEVVEGDARASRMRKRLMRGQGSEVRGQG